MSSARRRPICRSLPPSSRRFGTPMARGWPEFYLFGSRARGDHKNEKRLRHRCRTGGWKTRHCGARGSTCWPIWPSIRLLSGGPISSSVPPFRRAHWKMREHAARSRTAPPGAMPTRSGGRGYERADQRSRATRPPLPGCCSSRASSTALSAAPTTPCSNAARAYLKLRHGVDVGRVKTHAGILTLFSKHLAEDGWSPDLVRALNRAMAQRKAGRLRRIGRGARRGGLCHRGDGSLSGAGSRSTRAGGLGHDRPCRHHGDGSGEAGCRAAIVALVGAAPSRSNPTANSVEAMCHHPLGEQHP